MSKKKKQDLRKELENRLLETFSLTGMADESKKVKRGIKKAGKILSEIIKYKEPVSKREKRKKVTEDLSTDRANSN